MDLCQIKKSRIKKASWFDYGMVMEVGKIKTFKRYLWAKHDYDITCFEFVVKD